MKWKSGQTLTYKEWEKLQPTFEGAFARGDAETARRRRKRGLHQSYSSRLTPQVKANTVRMVASE